MIKKLMMPAILAMLVVLTLVVGIEADNLINLRTMVTDILQPGNGGLGYASPPYTLDLWTTGLVDGLAHTVPVTAGSYNFADGYSYTMAVNLNPSQTAAFSTVLPPAAIGLTKCVVNSDVSGTSETGVITISTSGTGQFIHYNGIAGTSGGSAVSPGTAGDKACVTAWSTTDWELYAQTTGWTNP